MEKIRTLQFHNEILLNTSLYNYLSIINDTSLQDIIENVTFDNFVETTKDFLKKNDPASITRYKSEMRKPYQQYIEKTLHDGWVGIKNNLLVSSYITFELFLNHLITVYCRYFPKLYSDEDIALSYAVFKDFKNADAARAYYIKTYVERFAALSFNEKINFVKKTLKLNNDDIWILHGREYIHDLNAIRQRIIHAENAAEIPDAEFYMFINYLCSLIFKLSAYSQIKYGIPFEWIKDLKLRATIAGKREL
jgi:hypothetical protein